MEEPQSVRDDVANERGEMTFAEQTRTLWGYLGVGRELATPDDDPWYDVPSGPPVLPDVDTTGWGRSKLGLCSWVRAVRHSADREGERLWP